ncbi:MAG: MerR family transcriptional regulator [Spirochaetaceae bacterium]
MSRFLIGQVCNALGVRAHVLRYWERHVELLSPAKDRSGRRMYTLRDVQLLFRLKYLVYTRGMSVEGASRKLVEEVQGGTQNRKAALDSLRGDLFRASLVAQRLGERLGGRSGDGADVEAAPDPAAAAAPGRSVSAAAPGRSVADEVRRMVAEALRRPGTDGGVTDGGVTDGGEGHRRGGEIRRAARRSRADTEAAPEREGDSAAARRLLGSAPLLVVTPTPGSARTVERYPGLLPLLGRGGETVLDRIGARLSALSREVGHEPIWLIGAAEPVVAAVRSHVARRRLYGLSGDRVMVYAEPQLSFLSADGRPLCAADGSHPAYALPLLSALRMAASAEPPPLTLILPVDNALPRIPDLEFISRHLEAAAEVSVKVARPTGLGASPQPAPPRAAPPRAAPPRATGEALLSAGFLTATERLRDSIEIRREVRRFAAEDDILETEARRGRFGMEQLLAAAERGLAFEIDAEAEVAVLRSPADWDSCSQRIRERS